MSELDLDIDHYNIEDLETFFRLTPPYNEHDVAKKESEIRTLLLSSGHIASYFKRDLILFLEEGKKRLIAHKVPVKQPTSIYIQDPPPVPPQYPEPLHAQVPSRQENILPPKQTDFSYQQVSEFFPGQLNPLDTRIVKKCLSFDSRFCPSSSSHHDFILSLPNTIQKVVSMECKSVEISPSAFYNISASLGNNYIYVSICAKEKEYNHTFVIPDGYYCTQTLLHTLNRMCQEDTNTPFVLLKWTLDPFGSGSCVLMLDPSPQNDYYLEKIRYISLDFTIDACGQPDATQDSFTRMGYLLGFTKTHYTGNSSYMGEIPIDVYATIPYFYLSIDDYQNRSIATFQPAFSQITMSPAILARLSFNKHTQTVDIVSSIRKYFGPIDISRLQIRLLDPHGKTIKTRTNFSFCLMFDVVYDL